MNRPEYTRDLILFLRTRDYILEQYSALPPDDRPMLVPWVEATHSEEYRKWIADMTKRRLTRRP